jgi:hypothetical protein
MFARTGYSMALLASDVVFAPVMVFPEANVDDVPHVNEIEANAFPLPVRCPFRVAVVGCTFVAAVVVEPGVPHGVPVTTVLSTPVFVDVTARRTTV